MVTPAIEATAITYADWSERLAEEAEKELNKITPALSDVGVTARGALRSTGFGNRQ